MRCTLVWQREKAEHPLAETMSEIELSRTKGDDAIATIKDKGLVKHYYISERLEQWIRVESWRRTKQILPEEAYKSAMKMLRARALEEGEIVETFIRVGCHGDKFYLDMCDGTWRAIEIEKMGWRIVDKVPVKCLRTKRMLPLPEPVRGGKIETLRELVNVTAFKLVVASILDSMHPRGPIPLTCFGGPPDNAKTWAARIIGLIDPHQVSTRSLSGKVEDVYISAKHSHVQSYDNLSGVSIDVSDALFVVNC
jgi:hypothetical protein